MLKYLEKNIIYLTSVLLGLISFVGALVYKIYALNNLGVFISISLSLVLFIIILYFHYKNNTSENGKRKIKNRKYSKIILIAYFLLLISLFFILFKSRSTNSLSTPWSEIPNYFFFLYFLATATLFLFILKSRKYILTLLSLHYFLSFSIALIVYKIGYGFDPFVHQATENLIKEKGVVDPKPLYYLGQYSLVVILNKITFISIVFLDKILVPFLSATLLPTAIYQFLNKWFENSKINNLIILLLLILPLSLFIVTTPQNLAYLFLILTILYGLTCSNSLHLVTVYVFAMASLLSQPIAGIPAILFAIAITIYHSDKQKIKKYLFAILFVLLIASLPSAFYFVEKNTPESVSVDQVIESVNTSTSLFNLQIPNQQNFLLNYVYLIGFNINIIIILLALFGVIIYLKNKGKNNIFLLNLFVTLSLIASYLLSSKLSFNYVIDYERTDFLNRILIVSIIFSLPLIMISLYWIIEKTLIKNKFTKIVLSLFAILLITNSLYLSYPRVDRYYNSKGYSVSQTDIDAVNWIEQNSNEDYIVLANQQVGAAALREIGFAKYYQTALPASEEGLEGTEKKLELYFYPIPTSSPLYRYYLKMVHERPTKKTMQEAMDLVNINESYFVLNKYWWAFDKIKEEAKLEADSWEEIDNGEIYIFRYNNQ